ncbi:hypothetical protein CGLO_02566 [Colletotrichum gloeosporioides Cg-14]|nr:hypothetical protein CGLO_02566 [Colletotrichum gloeosporioides Cg-14]
MYLYNY